MPNKEVTPRAQMCAVQTDQYIDRQFRPFSLLPLPQSTQSEMETVKVAVAMQAVGLDVLGKSDSGKVYDFNWKATNNAVRFLQNA